jgi:glutamate decarboxylase
LCHGRNNCGLPHLGLFTVISDANRRFVKMVHLGRVATDKDLADRVTPGLEKLRLGVPEEDDATVSVYGSRFAALDLPKHDMPENEMPREAAYRMIK